MCLHANLRAKLEKSPGVSKLSMLFVCIPSENEGDPEPQSDHDAPHHSDGVCSLLDRCACGTFLDRFQ